MCTKANRTLGFLRRNLGRALNQESYFNIQITGVNFHAGNPVTNYMLHLPIILLFMLETVYNKSQSYDSNSTGVTGS